MADTISPVYDPAEPLPALATDAASAPPQVSPNATPAGSRGVALLEVILCSGFPTQLAITLLLASAGMRMRTPAGGLSSSFVFTLSLLDAALVVFLICLFIRTGGERIRDVLIGQRRIGREILLGIALIPVVFLLVAIVLGVVLTFAPRLHNVARNPLEAMLETPADAMVFALVVMVAGGVREEIQRGFIIHRFDRYLGGALVGVIAYSLAFGMGHFEQGWDAALATGVLGAIWGVMYLIRRSVVAPMVSHAGFNLLQLIKLVALR